MWMSKNIIENARSAFNYRLKDDEVPHMQVKEFLAIIAISAAFVGGCAYLGKNVPSIIDWLEEAVSTDAEQGATMSLVPKKTLG